MDMLEAGEIDLMPNISYSRNAPKKLLFSSNPEGTERYYIYARPDRDDARVTLKHSRVSPSVTTPVLCKPSSASSGSPTRESPAHTGSITEAPFSLTRSQTARSTPSS